MKIILILFVLLASFYLYQLSLMRHRIKVGEEIARNTVPFEQNLDKQNVASILVIGDSTAFGVGALTPKESLAGLVGATYPEARIMNLGRNGMKAQDLVVELEKLQDKQFDLVMLHIGGNDIVRFTSIDDFTNSIDTVFKLATNISDEVTITVTGNMGTATLFPYGTGWLLEKRTRQVHQIISDTAQAYNSHYIDLFLERDEDPFLTEPTKYYAKDLFHPSGAGYALWFKQISKQLNTINLN
jgi:lysophospholipase L1-like esterase